MPQARLVVALVTMIVVLTGILVGLVLRPPYDNAPPGADTARPYSNFIERLKIPATESEPPLYFGTIPEHASPAAEPSAADHQQGDPSPQRHSNRRAVRRGR